MRRSQPAGESLLIEVFGEYGSQATITTWRADVVPAAGDANARRIAEIEELTTVSGLYKLALNPAKQFELRNLTVQATDLTLEIPSGSAFVAETPEGPTAVVLLGRGRMRFSPSDAAERTQVRIFGGDDVLATEFDAVFIRVRPGEFGDILPAAALKPVPVVVRRSPPRLGALRRLHRPDLQPGPARLEPRAVVADSHHRRPHRRGADAPARQPDVCAIDEGRRGHLAVRSAAAAEHRRLRLAAEAGLARALLQRRRARRLRRPPPGRRGGLLSGSHVGRGNRDARAESARLRARDADPPARRISGRSQRRRRRVRPAAPPARHRPEQRAREPAGDRPAQRRASA